MYLTRPFLARRHLAQQSRHLASLSLGETQQRARVIQPATPAVEEEPRSMLLDKFGRHHNYLRISLTERCNLRCQYCMPEDGVELQPDDKMMSTEELIRVANVFVDKGVDKIRLTGGEPLVRKDILQVCETLGAMPGLKKLAITTNGLVLKKKLPALQQAGAGRATQAFPSTTAFAGLSRRGFSTFTHIDEKTGQPTMVDVGDKRVTRRTATARTTVIFPTDLAEKLVDSRAETGKLEIESKKGPVFATAIIAGVMGAKKTSDLIPFCHPLPLENCKINMNFDDAKPTHLHIECSVACTHKTGVEMEALTGSSVAALCVYDMCKAMSHEIVLSETKLMEKTGGKKDYRADE